jgi:cell division septal protein FtsQ
VTPSAPTRPAPRPASAPGRRDGGGRGGGGSRGGGGKGGRNRIDPRISDRRTAVIRAQGRRRLLIVLIGLAGTGLLVGAWFLVHTSLFSARSITVVGNVHETAAQVVAQSGLASHPPLLDVNAGAAAARIEQLPWVRTASVQVSWPDGVRIAVTEEMPQFVVAAAADRWVTLSNDGRVLSEATTRPPGLLLLTVPQPPGAAGTILPAKDAAGLRVASTLPASFAAQVAGVTVEPTGWVQLSLTTPVLVDIGSATELTEKYEDVSSVLSGATLHNGDVIDVSIPNAVTVTAG